MVTYRKDLAREHWHRPWPVRILLVILGPVMILAGLVGWSLEETYGGDTNVQEYVIEHDAAAGLARVYGENGEMEFEATSIEDAEAYVDGQRGQHNYAVPILLIVLGALSIIAGIAPSPRRRSPNPATSGPLGANP
ncbi:MAG: hypothetical protein ABFR53_12915 [Actinomycetota bacterium]